jgi:S1-C subfamily serine protease
MGGRRASRALALLLFAPVLWTGASGGARAEGLALPPALVQRVPPLALPGLERPGAGVRQLVGSDAACGAPGRARDAADPCAGFGSGIFVTSDGEILTSGHVVDGCTRIAVRGATGTIYAARITATDSAYDLAMLRVTGDVPAVASFSPGMPAEPALITVLGFGENRPSLQGASSAVGQLLAAAPYTSDRGLIAFTAPVVRGHSGGPIIDQNGAVVGVVYAQYNLRAGVYFGVGVAAARAFMDRQAVRYSLSGAREPRGIDRVIRDSAAFTVFVQCLA